MEPADYRAVLKAARRKGLTMAQWVRQVLRAAYVDTPSGRVGRKLEAIRRAAQHKFPAPEIGQMLAEIETGYGVAEE